MLGISVFNCVAFVTAGVEERKIVMKRVIRGVFATVIVGLLAACGGGGGGGGGAPATATGKFIDGPVAGLGYSSGAQAGLTAADGSFTYEVGNTVRFFVGGVIIGEAPAGAVVTPLHLVPGSNVSTPQVLNIGRFLMSVGSVDPVTLKIMIPPEVTAAAKGRTINFATATDDELLVLVQAVKPGAALVDVPAANAHLSQCVYQQYDGTYTSGIFTGPAPSSTFELTISENGDVTGKGTDPKNVKNETITGQLTNGTQFNGVASGGCLLTGTLDVKTGVLSGTWQTPDGSGSGTFSIVVSGI